MALSETFPWFTNSNELILSWSNLLYVILAIFTVNCLQILYTILYNVYLHPLRRIPGPQLWIAFPILQQISSLKGNREFKIRGFHEKYGNIVRWAPDHVTFSDAQAWKDIYGHGHAEVPKYFPPGVRDGGSPNIIHSNASDHFRFRRAMLPAFSNAALNQQETLIMVYVNLLKERLHEVASLGQPTDIVEWYTFTTFDLIGDLAYGESFNGLKERKQNEWVGNIQKMMKLYPILVLSSMSPLVMRLLLLAAGPQIKKSKERHEQMSKALAMKRIQNKDQEHRGDFMDLMMRSRGEKHGLTDLELASNSDTLIVAGSETTATLLCGVTYYLLSNPESFATCRDEVRSAFSSADEITFKTATARLPYMMACLEEALRLFPPIPITLSREIPAGQTAVIMGQVFPEKVLFLSIERSQQANGSSIDSSWCPSPCHVPLESQFPSGEGISPRTLAPRSKVESNVCVFQ